MRGLGREVCRADWTGIDLAGLDWHHISVDELERRLSINHNVGLSEEQTKRRAGEYCKNRMTPPTLRSLRQDHRIFLWRLRVDLACCRRTSLHRLETSRRTTSRCQLSLGMCTNCCVPYTSSLQRTAGLVFFKGHGFYWDDVA